MKLTQKYFWLIILLSLILGIVWPTPGLILKNWLTPILMIMMTLGCLKTDLKELRNFKYDWRRYILILGNIFIVSSLIVFLCQKFLNPEIYLGLLLAVVVPCGISVVAFSIIFNGQPTKALITTTLAHLVAPLLVPIIVWLFAHKIININILSMFWLVFKLVIIPIFLAEIIKYFKFDKFLEKYIAGSNTILVSMLNWGTIAPATYLISWQNTSFLIALFIALFIFILQIILGTLFGRNKEEKITWSIVNFYKNTGLASVIALTSFGAPTALGVVAYILVTNAALVPFQFYLTKTNK
ncbi:MAG: Bile acid:sodium symporter family protein [Candidatus Magasanikbacteria bacterium GW2011_GWC2_37_14]|uniref:Bile acid:sodium symporter family protein n=1 Tax=Candidatus Magasanikbacteria bacterium GW2011_GWC2_37_14 TaxID=1619046 RepID=A0A0G0GC01_9BACT|nr:MAG: Bile acid:sodium symporter family protein [Candidatus Magasanikbacteria bacterium GW2011_GWC2_37_14]